MYIVKGFKKNEGKLDNGKAWSNYTLFCLKENEDGVIGYSVQAVKVPTKVLEKTFAEPSEMLDCKVRINYDIRTYSGKVTPVVVSVDIIE